MGDPAEALRTPVRGTFVFDGETRKWMLGSDARDRAIRPDWFRQPGASLILLALRKLEVWTLSDLAALRAPDFLRAYGRGSAGLSLLRRLIVEANVDDAERSPRPGPIVASAPVTDPPLVVRRVPRGEWAMRNALPRESRQLIEQLDGVLDHVSARDIRFGHAKWPDCSLADLLDRPAENDAQITQVGTRLQHLQDVASTPRQLLAELSELLPGSNRSFEIAKARWGWDGVGPKTLEETGRSFGLTRERVRQLVVKACKTAGFAYGSGSKRVEARPAYLPTAMEVAALTQEVGGAGYQRDIGRLGVERGLLECPGDLAAMDSLPELGLLPGGVFVRVRQVSGYVIVAADEDELLEFRDIVRRVKRELDRRSIVAIDEVVGQLHAEGVPATNDEVRGAALRDPVVALLGDDEYLWRPQDQRSGLMATLSKPLTVLGPLSGLALHRAVRRASSRRPEYHARIPQAVLEEALVSSPFVAAVGGSYRWVGEDSDVELHSLEQRFLEIIDDIGPVVTFNSFRVRLEAEGWNPITISLYLRTSPLLDSPSRGMYHLIGADVVPSDFEHARVVAPPRGYAKRRK